MVKEASVLIIDDELPLREALAANLERENYPLLFAENGEEGLARLRESSPTLVILDLRMPVMDGFEFLRQVGPKPADPFSVIVLTGFADDEAIRQCYQAGVTFFLQKPFNVYQLRGLVRSAITLRQLTNQLNELVDERTAALEQRVTEITALNLFYQEQARKFLGRIDQVDQSLRGIQLILNSVAPSSGLEENSTPWPFWPSAEVRASQTVHLDDPP